MVHSEILKRLDALQASVKDAREMVNQASLMRSRDVNFSIAIAHLADANEQVERIRKLLTSS